MKYGLMELTKEMNFKEATLEVAREWKFMRPSFPKGYSAAAIGARFEKFDWLLDRLNRIYGSEVQIMARDIDGGISSKSKYSKALNTIVLKGKLSIITFLHLYAQSRFGKSKLACQWGFNLYRFMYPSTTKKLVQDVNGTIRLPKSSKKPKKKRVVKKKGKKR